MYDIHAGVSRDLQRGHKVYLGIRKTRREREAKIKEQHRSYTNKINMLKESGKLGASTLKNILEFQVGLFNYLENFKVENNWELGHKYRSSKANDL